ncbi:MAG: hypothetical protein F4X44_11525 [Gammaproteobacteria bacterium]|nr:hypothetical protein [Gammaproteobacteria bacterium]MYD81229.1 hypothetical protein [Gammaproteobacteria bacterium]
MKRGTTKIVAAIAIGILLTAAVVLATIFLTRDRNEEATFADGAYQGYYIWCEKTDGTVTDTHNMGGGVTHTYEWIVHRCAATAPGETTAAYQLNLELASATGIYLHWLSCDKKGLLLFGDFVVDNKEYDSVLEETLNCIRSVSDST